MTRREFVELLSGTVAAWPLVAQAQQGTPLHIGVLGADAMVWNAWTVAFVDRLRELGWIEGDTIDIEYRWAGASSKRVSDFTAEFLRRHVDVIVTYDSEEPAFPSEPPRPVLWPLIIIAGPIHTKRSRVV